ncbi:MAG: protein kinase family protein [Nocardioides sp.]
MPHSIRPGDVLAGRYRLVDLLAESSGARFWRAHDRVLERHVALHVINAEDPRAAGLLEAARRSATILDRRILRVLDAESVDGLCYVVNEWGSGTSLDILVASSGPLEPRRAAWLVAEVADSVARAHDAGVAHGRLVPENVLVDRNGEIRVIGFSVDAAMHGLTGFRPGVDTSDLAGLLYCALTGKWAGVSASAVPRAPLEHGEVLRPRQVRAGIPRPLDSLCDAVLHTQVNAQSGGHSGGRSRELVAVTTAREISAYLDDFVGDPTGLSEALLASIPPPAKPDPFVVLPAVPEIPARDSGELAAVPTPETERHDEPQTGPQTGTHPDEEPEAEDVGLRTQAGLPIFDDDSDEVSWLAARATPAPPPPPFEEPPQRPLFAPTPPRGEPVRRARPGGGATNGGSEYWPWADTGTGRATGSVLTPVIDDEPPPGRSWLRLAAAIAVGLLLLVAIVVAYNLGRGKTPLGAEVEDDPTPTPTPSSSSPAAEPTPLGGLVADDLDPQGTPEPEENSEDAPLAVDGDAATSWSTSSYKQQLGPGGLKNGVGLSIDLNGQQSVTSVDVTLVGAPTDISLFLTDTLPTDVEGLEAVTSATADAETVTIDLPEPTEGRFLVVWLTSLPRAGADFRGTIAEVAVRGE